jgi:uncharacterized protein YhfF
MKTPVEDSIHNFWNGFLEKNPDYPKKEIPENYYFCDNETDANECADLVVRKIKRATATSLWWFEKHNETLPVIGNIAIITDWSGTPKAIIETTKVVPTPYNEITREFAENEGEGDKSLKYWKEVHQAYYEREMKPFKESFELSMIIICEYFRTIYVD